MQQSDPSLLLAQQIAVCLSLYVNGMTDWKGSQPAEHAYQAMQQVELLPRVKRELVAFLDAFESGPPALSLDTLEQTDLLQWVAAYRRPDHQGQPVQLAYLFGQMWWQPGGLWHPFLSECVIEDIADQVLPEDYQEKRGRRLLMRRSLYRNAYQHYRQAGLDALYGFVPWEVVMAGLRYSQWSPIYPYQELYVTHRLIQRLTGSKTPVQMVM